MRAPCLVIVLSLILVAAAHRPALAGPRFVVEPELSFFNELRPGTTTLAEAESLLGAPTDRTDSADAQVWIYRRSGAVVYGIVLGFSEGLLALVDVTLAHALDEGAAREIFGPPEWRRRNDDTGALTWSYALADGIEVSLHSVTGAAFSHLLLMRCPGSPPRCRARERGPF